jgi:3-oxoacyl-[acyl-carrier protein] reductase
MQIDLAGTTALVTGGSGGLGESISAALHECGARVAIHYHAGREKAEEIADRLGGGCEAFGADLSSHEGPRKLFASVLDSFERLDLLVNNAGIFAAALPVSGHDKWIATWDRTIAVNLTSTGILCREAIEHFRTIGGGRIVSIASRAAFRGETAGYLAYAASKGGMISLSRSIARSFGKENIKSFSLAPGYVRTPMTSEYLDLHEEEMVEEELALGRMTEPGDVAPLVAFIASGRLDHATGCTIDINGGSYIH